MLRHLSVALAITTAVTVSAQETSGWGWDDVLDIFKPKLTPTAYQKSIKLDGLLTHSRALQSFASSSGHTRSFGTPGYNKSADYVYSLAKKAGYNVYRQANTYPASDIHYTGLIVNGQNHTGHTAFAYSGSTPKEGVTGDVVLVPGLGCVSSEWEGTTGKIALVERGNCTFAEKAGFGTERKVLAVMIYNNVEWPIPVASRINPTFETNPPALSLTRPFGLFIKEQLQAGPVTATVFTDITNEFRTAENVIAETKWGDKDNVIFIGGHLDSVPAGPGINDDGSGSATVAELALQLSKFKKARHAIRFAWWSTEEVGLIGSRYYVDHLTQDERDRIALYINLDMTASPNYILGVYDADNSAGGNTGIPAPAGSRAAEKMFQTHFVTKGLNHTAYAFTSGSDYRPFIDVGIPAAGVATGAGGIKTEREAEMFGGQAGIAYDPCYHQACDTIDNLAHDAYVYIAHATAAVVAELAHDLSPIKDEQALFGRGMNIPRDENSAPEELSHLGHDCSDHVEL